MRPSTCGTSSTGALLRPKVEPVADDLLRHCTVFLIGAATLRSSGL